MAPCWPHAWLMFAACSMVVSESDGQVARPRFAGAAVEQRIRKVRLRATRGFERSQTDDVGWRSRVRHRSELRSRSADTSATAAVVCCSGPSRAGTWRPNGVAPDERLKPSSGPADLARASTFSMAHVDTRFVVCMRRPDQRIAVQQAKEDHVGHFVGKSSGRGETRW